MAVVVDVDDVCLSSEKQIQAFSMPPPLMVKVNALKHWAHLSIVVRATESSLWTRILLQPPVDNISYAAALTHTGKPCAAWLSRDQKRAKRSLFLVVGPDLFYLHNPCTQLALSGFKRV